MLMSISAVAVVARMIWWGIRYVRVVVQMIWWGMYVEDAVLMMRWVIYVAQTMRMATLAVEIGIFKTRFKSILYRTVKLFKNR